MSYIGQEPGQGQAERFIFTASGSETVVSTADDGRLIGYTAGQVSVYLNGVKLVVGTDCIATNGSTITGLSALSASDVVEVIALSAFSPSDTVSAASGGTFSGAVTLPSPVINTGVSGTAILDEDAMGSDSATKLATQQSIKAYVDSAASQATTAAQGVGTGNSPTFAGFGGTAGQITAKAWVNFDGTFVGNMTLANGGIRDSHNVSSITDNGTGSYDINFDTAMSNTTYAVASGCTYEGGTVVRNMTASIQLQTVTEFRTYTVYSENNSTTSDAEMVSMIVMGD